MKVYKLAKSVLFPQLAGLAIFAISVGFIFLSRLRPTWLPHPLLLPHLDLLSWLFLVLLGCATCTLILIYFLRLPYAITWMDDNSLEFRSPARRTQVPVNEIISIKAMTPGLIKIKHRRGSIRVQNQITGFYELISRIKSLNPKAEIEGC